MGNSDAHYRFIYANVGANGRISDGEIWNRSKLCQDIETGKVNIPPPDFLPDSKEYKLFQVKKMSFDNMRNFSSLAEFLDKKCKITEARWLQICVNKQQELKVRKSHDIS